MDRRLICKPIDHDGGIRSEHKNSDGDDHRHGDNYGGIISWHGDNGKGMMCRHEEKDGGISKRRHEEKDGGITVCRAWLQGLRIICMYGEKSGGIIIILCNMPHIGLHVLYVVQDN